MANLDSTAVNELIDQVASTPLVWDDEPHPAASPGAELRAEDLPPLPPSVLPHGTRTNIRPAPPLPIPTTLHGMTRLPPPRRATTATGTIPPPLPQVAAAVALPPYQRLAPPPPNPYQAFAPPPPVPYRAFAPTPSEAFEINVDETRARTARVARGTALALLKRMAPMAALVVAGVSVGYFAFHKDSPALPAAQLAQTATPPVAEAPEATAPPVVAQPAEPLPVKALPAAPTLPTAPAAPTTIDVPFDSKPSGATVMLVDNGNTQVLGVTPIIATIDPTRTYDVVFTLDGHPTRMEHLDPATTHRVAIVFGAGDAVAAAPRSSAPPVAAARHAATQTPVDQAPRRAVKTVAVAAPAAPPKTLAAGNGLLMVSTKPPCEIVVDGKSTHLTTPQRAIALPAGGHKITLINAQQKIKTTIEVQIAPKHSTKLIQDFMKHHS